MNKTEVKIIDEHNATVQEVTGWALYFDHHVKLYLQFLDSPDYENHFKQFPNGPKKTELNHRFKSEIKLFTNLATSLKQHAANKSYQVPTVS